MSGFLYKETQLALFENTLPPETDEKGCHSFEDLVYVSPKENVNIPCSALSEKQKSFLIDRLSWDKVWFYIHPAVNHFYYISKLQKWYTEVEEVGEEEQVVSFNDIFIHKDDLGKQ